MANVSDIAAARHAWETAKELIKSGAYHLVLLDELNIVLRYDYLPVDENELARRLRELEDESRKKRQTQLFIETPYRNDRLLRVLLARCAPSTLLCVATDLTLASESVTTRPIAEWRKTSTTIGKRPTVFLLLAS